MDMSNSRFCRQLTFGLVLAIFTIIQGVAQAQDQDSPLKIGYLNANKIMNEAPQGISAFDMIKEEFADREEELRQTEKVLTEIQAELDNETDASKRRKLESEIREIRRDFDRGTLDFEEDFNYRRNEELANLQDLVSEVILDIARTENFDLIVQDPVVWASDNINITDKILNKLKELHESESQ